MNWVVITKIVSLICAMWSAETESASRSNHTRVIEIAQQYEKFLT